VRAIPAGESLSELKLIIQDQKWWSTELVRDLFAFSAEKGGIAVAVVTLHTIAVAI
jgi:hypothetical protein